MNNWSTKIGVLLLFFWCISISLYAQESDHDNNKLVFAPFEGVVYKMPVMELKKGKLITRGIQEYYSDTIYSYEKISDITLNRVDIQETSTHSGKFPGVEQKTRFALVLHSGLKIDEEACYEFSLHSDDGSILWIEDHKIVDNDGGHGMRLKKDSVVLKPGIHKVKLWYFQGMADRFGIKLQGAKAGPVDICNKELKQKTRVFTLQAFHFDFDKSELNESGKVELQKLLDDLAQQDFNKITIKGHTDGRGSEDYNLKLSELLAKYVGELIQKELSNKQFQIDCLAKGGSELISHELTEKAHAKNRRVEIIIE